MGRTKSWNEPVMDRVRARLATIRRDKFNDNGRELAKALKISQPMVSDFIAGKRGMGLHLLVAIADYVGCSADELLERPVPLTSLRSMAPLDLGLAVAAQDGALDDDLKTARAQLAGKAVTWSQARDEVLYQRRVREERGTTVVDTIAELEKVVDGIGVEGAEAAPAKAKRLRATK